jgi:hypothetical protein
MVRKKNTDKGILKPLREWPKQAHAKASLINTITTPDDLKGASKLIIQQKL